MLWALAALWMIAEAAVDAAPAVETGKASYYSAAFHGRRTASGERYSPKRDTCAHRTHPFGTTLQITVVRSGKSATCVVNDRGPHQKTRIVDVSRSVAAKLGLLHRGVSVVTVEVVSPSESPVTTAP
jgi:rare lipoprotein A